jgi:hypothetical protein
MKIKNEVILEVLNCQKLEIKNKNKNHWNFIFGFQCVAKKTIEGWLKFVFYIWFIVKFG